MIKYKFLILNLALSLSGLLGLVLVQPVAAQAVTQSYGSDIALQNGMIVQIDTKNTNNVVPSTQTNVDDIHGVVVAANDAPVSLSGDSKAAQQVFVATDGKYQVLVSDQNGPIKVGDYISISALAGVGMKATDHQAVVLGKALSNFDGSSNVLSTTTLKEDGGKTLSVHLGYALLNVVVAHNPLLQSTQANLPGFLERASQSIANKPVNAIRVYVGLAVLLGATLLSGALLYGGVRSSMTAMGRNPLARKVIMRNLFQVILTSIIIFLLGIFAVYLLLKL